MIVLVVLALLAAQAPAQATAPPAPAPKPVKEKRICRTDGSITGSMIPVRTCKTKAEWEAESGARAKTSNQKAPATADGGNSD